MKRKIIFTVVICLSCIIGLAYYFVPVFKPLPVPTGPCVVGTIALYFSNDQEQRAIPVRIWYPATAKIDQSYAWLGKKMPFFKKIVAEFYRVPLWVSNWLVQGIVTHSYSNAPLAQSDAPFPVVIFSHGLFGILDLHHALIENLASHGYIVVGIDHANLSLITSYPDGNIESCKKSSDQFNTMPPADQHTFQSEAIELYKADMQCVLDYLEQLNKDVHNALYNRINLDKIGVMGHSAGGTATIELCRVDTRCKAAIDLDGWYDHILGDEPIQQPLLLLFGSKSVEVSEPRSEYLKRKGITRQEYFEREENIKTHKQKLCASSNCSMVILPDISHSDFSDFVLLKWPFRPWGSTDSHKAAVMINNHVVEFFDNYLK